MRDRVLRGRLGLVRGRLRGLSARRRALRTALQRGLLGRDQRGRVDRPFGCRQARAGGLLSCGRGLFLPLLLGFVLAPDRLEFHLDHARRHREIVTLGQLVKERPLQPLPRDRIVVALHPLANLLAQLGEVFQAGRLGQLIVDLRRQAVAHFLDRNLEHALLAGQLGIARLFRKGHPDLALLAGAGADQLIGEAGQVTGGAELDLAPLAAAAGNLLVAGPADDVGDDDVAVFRRPLDRLSLALRFGEPFEGAVDILVRKLGNQPLDPEIAEIGHRHVGQQLDRHLVFEVGAFRRRDDLDPRRQRRAQVVLAHRLGRAALHRALQNLAPHRRAIALAQQLHRHLARAEAGDAHRLPDLAETAADPLLDLGRRDGDLELAL